MFVQLRRYAFLRKAGSYRRAIDPLREITDSEEATMPSRLTSTGSVAAVIPCVGGVVLKVETSARSGIGYSTSENQRALLKEALFSVALVVGTAASLVGLSSGAKNIVPTAQRHLVVPIAEAGTSRVSYNHIATYHRAHIAE